MSTDSICVGAVQLQSQDDVAANLASCRELVAEAHQRGAELVLLPENFAFFGAEDQKARVAERLGDSAAPIQSALSELARAEQVVLIAGGFPERNEDGGPPFNSCLVYSKAGELAAKYRKIHLFDVELGDGTSYRESRGTTAGAGLTTFDHGAFRIGLSICYDLRFPELYRGLVALGANVLVVPAAFTLHTGRDHWHTLLRARAIESQCWVVAAAQWGKHPHGRTTYGHSLIVDPWGQVVADASDRVGVVTGILDLEYLARVRSSLPCLSHRRL